MIFELIVSHDLYFFLKKSRSFVHWKHSCQFKLCPRLSKLILDNEISLNGYIFFFFPRLNNSSSSNLFS